MSFLGKYLYMTMAMYMVRFRYYTGWMIATANITSPGLNYNPDGKNFFDKYGKIVGARPISVETADNMRERLEHWNTASQVWLKNYVYLRIVSEEEARKNPKKAAFASNMTFMISAFWHGYYPMYYVSFFIMFFVQQISKTLFKMREKLRWIPEPIGFVLRWVLTSFFFDYGGTAFKLLGLGKGLIFFRNWHYIPNIVLLLVYLVLTYTPLGKPGKTKKLEDSKKDAKGGVEEAKKKTD